MGDQDFVLRSNPRSNLRSNPRSNLRSDPRYENYRSSPGIRVNPRSNLRSDPRYENYRSSPGIQVIPLCPGFQACLLKAWVQNTIYTCFISWVGGSGKQISDDIFVSGWEQEIILKVGLTKSFCFVHLLIT